MFKKYKELVKENNRLTMLTISQSIALEKNKELILKFISFFNTIMGGHDSSQVTSKHMSRVASLIEEFFRIVKYSYFKDKINCDYDVFKNSVIMGAYLHDIGKFYISDSILNKNGKLTNEEFDSIKEHPILGSQCLIELPLNETDYNMVIINNIVLHHHENISGDGYPNGLKGYQIPIEARIIAVFDRLEALMAKRSYKEPFSLDKSISILKNENKVDNEILKFVEDNKKIFKKYEE